MLRTLVFLVLFTSIVQRAGATTFSYEDCLLQGLRGVGSDSAASMVKRACDVKREQHSARVQADLAKLYGEELTPEERARVRLGGWGRNGEEKGLLEIHNDLSQTVTYVRISLAYATGERCGEPTLLGYDVTVPAGSVALVRIPLPRGVSAICREIVYGRARGGSWLDWVKVAWTIGGREPLTVDQLAARVDLVREEERKRLWDLIGLQNVPRTQDQHRK